MVIKEKNAKNGSVKKPKTSKKTKKAKAKKDDDNGNVIDSGIVNEERRAYLEEARSQDASE